MTRAAREYRRPDGRIAWVKNARLAHEAKSAAPWAYVVKVDSIGAGFWAFESVVDWQAWPFALADYETIK
jgi:hypothetical protein